ncbi:MAG: hypothetical protein PHH04_07355 [Thomasclavelia sp.]|jgi:uncharacterized membrane protein YobD (UPF0266 family)|nr:hypothetical protein [Thomasclavelia sp.]
MNIGYILPIVVAAVLLWITYVIINYIVTVIKTTKKDPSYKLCLNTVGRIVIIGLYILYLIGAGVFIYFLVTDFGSDIMMYMLNGFTLFSILVAYASQSIIFVGSRHMLIGRVELDYRKIKRVQFPKKSKMNFTYGMKEFHNNVSFCDASLLKKAITKTK